MKTFLKLTAVASILLSLAAADGWAQQRKPDPKAPPPSGLRLDNTVDGLYLAARQAEKANDYAAAADLLDRALARYRDDPILTVGAFRMRLAAGRVAQASELAERVVTLIPSDALANLVIAIEAVRKKDFKRAEQTIARMPMDKQLGFFSTYLLAWIKAGQRDFATAYAGLESGVVPGTKDVKESGLYLLHAGLIDELAGKNDDAERKLRQAYESGEPNNYRLATTLAGFLRRHGKAKDAEALLRKYHEVNADVAPLDALLNDKAMARVPQVQDGMAEVLFDLFSIFATNGRQRDNSDDLAMILAQITLYLRPDHDAARLLMAELLEAQDNPAATIEAYRGIDKGSALYWRARLRIAVATDKLDRLDDATAQLKAMMAERPERYDAALSYADILREREKFAEAAAAYEVAIERLAKPEAKHWPIFYSRGIALERSKQWQKAEADFKKALALQPDQPFVLNYLAYTWVDQGINVTEARAMLEKAVSLRPSDGAIVDSLAWAVYRQGDYPRAVELLERAVALQSTDPTINEHLGDAYWQVGRKIEARFQWQRALGLKPEADRIPDIEKKLREGLGEVKPASKGG